MTQLGRIVRRWVAGERLAAAEIADVAAVLPQTGAFAKRMTVAAYGKKLAEYVAEFVAAGMPQTKDATRKLKGWIAHGRDREEPDYPPFEHREQMASWWRRCMKYAPPDFMVAWEREDAGSAKKEPGKSDKPEIDDVELAYGDLALDEEIASDFSVRILASAAKDSLRRYKEAIRDKDYKRARAIREELLDDVKALQKGQVDALKLLAAKGDYLRKADTMAALNGLLAMQDTSFYNALEDVIREAAPHLAADERRDLALKYRDRVFEHFHKSEFAEAWAPEPMAA